MIKTIIKDDGSQEPFSANKLNGWGVWASNNLGDLDWSSVVMETVASLPETCSSRVLQEQLIKSCLNRSGWNYNRMAGRLNAPISMKRIHGKEYPTVKELHEKLLSLGLMIDLGYSDLEYEVIEQIIDHNKNTEYPYFQSEYIQSKYSLKNIVDGARYETPQFVYMRMAMALSVDRPNRIKDVAKFYKYFSENKLSAPTPNYTNLGTSLKGFASCCVITTEDSAPSLAAHDHIAYTMTYSSAGIGSFIKSRSLKDPVKNGSIKHLGKLPLYAALGKAVGAMTQNSRGGSATTFYNCFDPEVLTISKLKNPMSTKDKQNRDLDYAIQTNKFFAKKVAKNEDVFLFNTFTAPDLFEAFYTDEDLFEELYEKYENDESFEKKYINARSLVVTVQEESFATGRAYFHQPSEANRHTPFTDTIYSSNLCVAPETLILTKNGYVPISELEDESVDVWNGVEWSNTTVRKTGENVKLIKVKTSDGQSIECTPYHKFYVIGADGKSSVEKRAHELVEGDKLEKFDLPETEGETYSHGFYSESSDHFNKVVSVTDEGRVDDTYCFNEPKRHRGMFNGILTGQCLEINLPTKGYENTGDLYQTDHENGEVALCSLAATNASLIESDEEYEDVMYYALLMIDICIHSSQYELPHVGYTAKNRLNAGVGLLGVAHKLAKEGVKYSSQDGKNLIHEMSERHMYFAIKASLVLSKEYGVAPWIDKTKWPSGWLPIDTYNKNVDQLVTVDNKYDWEGLRSEIINNGGIRNSCLIAHMPTESSSKAAGTTNGIYPVRELSLIKTDADNVTYFSAPDSDDLVDDYELAWDIDWKDMMDCYAIVQKFTDQGISADLWRRVAGDVKVGSSEMIKQYLYMMKVGVKSRYYLNSKTSDGKELDIGESCSSGGCKL